MQQSITMIHFRSNLEKWLYEHGEEQRLPGFSNYNNRQMFWMTWGRLWCETYEKYNSLFVWDTLWEYADTHTIGKYRILGPLQNNENFAKDFKCKEGSRMNPKLEKKCTFW